MMMMTRKTNIESILFFWKGWEPGNLCFLLLIHCISFSLSNILNRLGMERRVKVCNYCRTIHTRGGSPKFFKFHWILICAHLNGLGKSRCFAVGGGDCGGKLLAGGLKGW